MRLLLLLTVLAVVTTAKAAGVTVPGLGYVQGTETESAWTKRPIHAFYGIRYALAPSGSRRFAPPEPVESWDDNFYNATSPGRDCPNLLKDVTPNYPGEDLEDCLFLNVFTPYIPDSTKNNDALLPVMIYIHGGAFYEGSAKHHPPNYLLERDVLLVVIQYRLGPLGFMSMQTDGIPGNVGFMDQVMALKWVNKNIKSFGGDKNQVTLFGQSAGAASVSLMLMSPMVEDELFQKVIIQSSSALNTWIIDDHPRDFAKALFEEFTDRKLEGVDDGVMEEYFKNSTVPEFRSALHSLFTNSPHRSSKIGRAVVQEAGSVKFLDSYPEDLLKQGKIRSVPMMAGVTKHDGSYLVTSLYDRLEHFGLLNHSPYLRNNVTADALKMLGVHDDSGAFADILENMFFKKLFNEDRELSFADIFPRITDIAGMLFFKAPTLKHAKINSLYQKPSYLYTFDYMGENTRFGYGQDMTKYTFKGVHHSDDLLYLFPFHYTTSLSEEDVRTIKVMVDLWTSFAINEVPCSPGADVWEPLKPGRNSPYYHIDNSTGYLDRRDFVDTEYVAATNEIEESLRNLE